MARKKAFIGAAISLGTSIVGGLMSSAAKRRQQEEQQRQQEAVYRAKEGSNMASSYNQQHANDYDLSLENERLYTSSLFKGGGSIHIKDSKKGTFTAAAKKRGQSVQGFASKVLANKDNYSPAMVKKAVFAHNAPKWKHRLGGIVNTLFRLGGGTKLKATKRATKQNLGLENANKVGVNAPTAYRRLASESSQPSRTILSSEDKVVQKALESAISISPVKEVDDTRTTYKGGGKTDVKLNNNKDGKQENRTGNRKKRINRVNETRSNGLLSRTKINGNDVSNRNSSLYNNRNKYNMDRILNVSSDNSNSSSKVLRYMESGGETKISQIVQSNDAIQTNKPIIQDGKRKYRRDKGSQQVYQVESIKKSKEKVLAENVLSGFINLLNPTGVSNYPDIYNSISNGDDFGTILSNAASSFPVMGKVGRALKGFSKNKTINRLVRRSNRLDNKLNYVDKSIDNINDAAKNFNLREYSKSILDNATRNLEIFKKVENSPMNKYDDIISGIKSSAEVISTAQREANKEYKTGGKADVNNIITEGGDAKRIGHQTFLLRGRKHRNGGIVLGKGRNAIEAEGGEVVKIDKNTMKILSTVPMANGESPANRVLKGESPNKVFDSQEQFKDRNNLNNKKYQDGGSKNISGRTTESFGTRKNNSFINSLLRIRSINNEFVNDKTKTNVKFVGGKEQKYETVPVFKKNNFNLLSDRDNNTVNRISDSLSNNYYLKNRKSIQNLNGYSRIIKDASIIGANAAIKNVPNVIEGLNDLNNNLDRNFEESKLLDRYYENTPVDINLKENNNTNKQLENMLRYINGRPNMRLGGSSLVGRRKAALGDYLNIAGDAFNIISPLLGGSRTKRTINRMVAPTQPTQLQAANLRTTYNIQPQLTDIYNTEQQSIAETNRNTASSVASQARGTRLRQLGLNQRNQLRGQQQNIETQLINQNRLNRQQVTNQNIAATNDWRDRVSQFVNDQIVSKANVDNQIIENVSAGIRDLQLRGDKNRQERNALTAIMASNPEQINLFMKKRKEYENLLDRNSRSLLRPYRCGGSVKRKMKR